MDNMIYRLNLQLFAEGEGGGNGAEGEANEGRRDGLANQEVEYVYGKQGDDSVESINTPTDLNETPQQNDYASFREQYKDQIGKEIQDAIQKRFKNQQDNSDTLNQLIDAIYPLYSKYGIEDGNFAALGDAIANDDTLYEDLAYDKGLTPEQYRYQQALERKVAQQEQEQAQREAQRKAREDYDKWMAEAQELQQIYPNFSIENELANDDFKNDLMSGKSMKKAFESAHLDEILQGAIQSTANSVRESVVNNIKARGMRPSENGSSSKAGVQIKSDVNSLDDKDIDRIIRQVKQGKKISF